MSVAGQKSPSRSGNSERRQQVIDAAAAIFSRLGYHGTSTRQIADQLNIKVASLYFHIDSKEDALEEICTLGINRALLYLDDALEEQSGLAGQLRRFFRHQRADLIAYADYVSVMMHDGRNLPPDGMARLARLTREFRLKLDQMLQLADARGEIAAGFSPRQARFVVIGAVRSISELYTSGRARNIEDVMERWAEAVIRGLVAEYVPPPPVVPDLE